MNSASYDLSPSPASLPVAKSCGKSCKGGCRKTEQHYREEDPSSALLDSPDNVLSTLHADGSRRWLRPRLETGRLWKRRRVLAYALIAFFVVLPHLRINGLPPILLNIVERKFIFFGHVFLPTDTLLLALLMLAV